MDLTAAAAAALEAKTTKDRLDKEAANAATLAESRANLLDFMAKIGAPAAATDLVVVNMYPPVYAVVLDDHRLIGVYQPARSANGVFGFAAEESLTLYLLKDDDPTGYPENLYTRSRSTGGSQFLTVTSLAKLGEVIAAGEIISGGKTYTVGGDHK